MDDFETHAGLLVATSALEKGVELASEVSQVALLGLFDPLTAYQMAGRAGRRGEKALILVFHSKKQTQALSEGFWHRVLQQNKCFNREYAALMRYTERYDAELGHRSACSCYNCSPDEFAAEGSRFLPLCIHLPPSPNALVYPLDLAFKRILAVHVEEYKIKSRRARSKKVEKTPIPEVIIQAAIAGEDIDKVQRVLIDEPLRPIWEKELKEVRSFRYPSPTQGPKASQRACSDPRRWYHRRRTNA